jgi:hypothetical protein
VGLKTVGGGLFASLTSSWLDFTRKGLHRRGP